MGKLDIDSLFTKFSLEKSIKIWTNNLFENSDIVLGHWEKKWIYEFKDLLSSAAKVMFNNILYQQTDGVAMGSRFGSPRTKLAR